MVKVSIQQIFILTKYPFNAKLSLLGFILTNNVVQINCNNIHSLNSEVLKKGVSVNYKEYQYGDISSYQLKI